MKQGGPLPRYTPLARKPFERKVPDLTVVRSSVRTSAPTKGRTPTDEERRRRQQKQADDLFSLLVRSRGVCAAAGYSGAADYELPKRYQDPETLVWYSLEGREYQTTLGDDCLGPLQCCHIFSRRYQATRHAEDNAWCMCLGHHLFFTNHPLAWITFTRDRMGADAYHALQQRALRGEIPELTDVIATLKAELANRG